MGTFKRILSYISKNWLLFLVSAACMFFSAFISVQIPLLTKEAVETVLPLFSAQSTVDQARNRLLMLTLEIVGLTVVVGVFSFIQRYTNTYFAQKVVYDIRNDVFASLQNQSFAFYGRSRTGQLLAKVTTDVDRIRFFVMHQFMLLIYNIFLLAATLSIMLLLNLKLTLFLVPLMPIIFSTYYLFGKKIRPIFAKMREQYGHITTILHENVRGIRVVRAFAQEDFEKTKFRNQNSLFFYTQLERAKIRAFYLPIVDFFMGLGLVVIFWYGGTLIINEPTTFNPGDLFIFTIYFALLVMPMRRFSNFISGYHLSMATGNRVFGIVDAEIDIQEKPDALKLPSIKGHVKLEHVYFDYQKGKTVLKDISLEAKPGETVALLGETGSGKSTVIRLIPRFYDVTSGKITIDGYDVRDVNLKSLRQQIGIVSQETFLFTMTIKENIAYGKPRASMTEITSAAKAAEAHDFISAMPQGYNSRVGERGVTLSVGQRQRIAIARALLLDPNILILDDSTSSVDVETEYKIQQALRVLLKQRTAFVITQRISTIRNADKIIVLDNGEVREEGTHEILMTKKGAYYQIHQSLYEAQQPHASSEPESPEQEDPGA